MIYKSHTLINKFNNLKLKLLSEETHDKKSFKFSNNNSLIKAVF